MVTKFGRFGELGAGLATCTALVLSAASPAWAEARDWIYAVRPGDTLIGLTQALLKPPATWQKLQQINAVPDPMHLVPGKPLRIPVAWLRREAAVAEIVHVHGAVHVRREGSEAAAARSGLSVRAGDLITTGPQSTLTLRFIDGSRLLVSPESAMTIESLMVVGKARMAETQIRIDGGGVESRVSPQKGVGSKYEIMTPTLNLGVRGTDFQVRFDPRDKVSRAEVHAGRVAAQGARASVRLDAGFGTLAAADGDPQPPRRLAGAPELRGIAGKLEHVPLRFSWEPVADAKAYRAQVYADRTFDRLLLDGTFVQPAARWSDLPDGRYVLRVRSVDTLGLEGAATTVDFVLKARPEAPFTIQPGEGAKVHGDGATFKWAASSAARSYRLQVSERPDFKELRLDQKDLTGTEFTLALSPGGYHWRIATVAHGNDQGPFSDALSFVQRRIPESPALEAPRVDDKEIAFRWKARDPGQRFEYQFASDAEFRNLLVERQTAEPMAVLPTPEPGVYHLRVKAIDADGFAGPFGAAQSIEIEGSLWRFAPLLLLLFAL